MAGKGRKTEDYALHCRDSESESLTAQSRSHLSVSGEIGIRLSDAQRQIRDSASLRLSGLVDSASLSSITVMRRR